MLSENFRKLQASAPCLMGNLPLYAGAKILKNVKNITSKNNDVAHLWQECKDAKCNTLVKYLQYVTTNDKNVSYIT